MLCYPKSTSCQSIKSPMWNGDSSHVRTTQIGSSCSFRSGQRKNSLRDQPGSFWLAWTIDHLLKWRTPSHLWTQCTFRHAGQFCPNNYAFLDHKQLRYGRFHLSLCASIYNDTMSALLSWIQCMVAPMDNESVIDSLYYDESIHYNNNSNDIISFHMWCVLVDWLHKLSWAAYDAQTRLVSL